MEERRCSTLYHTPSALFSRPASCFVQHLSLPSRRLAFDQGLVTTGYSGKQGELCTSQVYSFPEAADWSTELDLLSLRRTRIFKDCFYGIALDVGSDHKLGLSASAWRHKRWEVAVLITGFWRLWISRFADLYCSECTISAVHTVLEVNHMCRRAYNKWIICL